MIKRRHRQNLYRDLCNRYGCHLPARQEKLNEEFSELNDALKAFAQYPSLDNARHVYDEFCDVQLVLWHIGMLMEIDTESALDFAKKKIDTRDSDPDFMR